MKFNVWGDNTSPAIYIFEEVYIMKEVLIILARICDALAWWFAEKAGEVHIITTEEGAVIKSWTRE